MTGHDAGRILPAMLQLGERIINRLIYRTVGHDAGYTAHNLFELPG
jgi:hypothetical protein